MDMTQSMKHQVEGPIMQEKDWTRAFGRLCAQVFVPRTTLDIAKLPKLDKLKQFTPLIHSKSTFRNKFLRA
jgi:hypothetical protein